MLKGVDCPKDRSIIIVLLLFSSPLIALASDDVGILSGPDCRKLEQAQGPFIPRKRQDLGEWSFRFPMDFDFEVYPEKVEKRKVDRWKVDESGARLRKTREEFDAEKRAAEEEFKAAKQKAEDDALAKKMQALREAGSCTLQNACRIFGAAPPADPGLPNFCSCRFTDPEEERAQAEYLKAFEEFIQETEPGTQPSPRQAPAIDQFRAKCTQPQPGVGDLALRFLPYRSHVVSCQWRPDFRKEEAKKKKRDEQLAELRKWLSKVGLGSWTADNGTLAKLLDGMKVGDSVLKLYNEGKINLVWTRGSLFISLPGRRGDWVTIGLQSRF